MMVNLWHRQEGPRPDYFESYTWTDEFELHGHAARMTFWNKPLHAMTDAFTAAGFRIAVIGEPHPVPAARELFPGEFETLDTFPSFLFFVLEAGR